MTPSTLLVNTQNLIFENSGEREDNDRGSNTVYDMIGYRYLFVLRPSTKFWRFGVRMSNNTKANFKRYQDPAVKHLEVCAGIREVDQNWKAPETIQVQHYNIVAVPNGTLFGCHKYKQNSEVRLEIECTTPGVLTLRFNTEGCRPFSSDLQVGDAQYFALYGWADNKTFSFKCAVQQEQIIAKITLNPVKALTGADLILPVKDLAIFFGRNNCGKTSILVGACNAFMNRTDFSMDYLSPNRFYTSSNYSYDNEADPRKSEMQEGHRKRRSGNSPGQNEAFDWMYEISLQPEEIRNQILNFFNSNFETWEFIELKKGKYTTGIDVKVNGHSPVEQGTGARAALPIIIQLFNPDVTFLAIDEPELGLEPATQKVIFRAIKSAALGIDGFPKKRILLATHSNLFLDREKISNNFRVSKVNGQVSIHQLNSIDELQDATFRLLGNNPADLFFPENIVVVEGKSDAIFLKAVLLKMYEAGDIRKRHIEFHFLEGIDKVTVGLEGIIQMLKTQTYVPIYKDKICGLFDKPLKDSEKKRIDGVKMFFSDPEGKRFATLDEPAIEYLYPIELVNSAFNCSFDKNSFYKEVGTFLSSISNKPPFTGKFLGIELSKTEFASRISTDFLNYGKLKAIDATILDLLRKADSLSF